MWYRYADTINGQNFNLHVLDNKVTQRETRIYQNLILQNPFFFIFPMGIDFHDILQYEILINSCFPMCNFVV